jgi:D-lactate dehydrogenase
MLAGKYKTLYKQLLKFIDAERIFHDPLHTLAYGTDASFYRLIPKLVIKARDEQEVSCILNQCAKLSLPVTFRAAGTSLSGQAISDSVLIIAGNDWKKYTILDNGHIIRLQPGLTGGRTNAILAKFGRKIGPDPASINTAMIGGIAANNASGMCCGTAENSYKTVASMRIVFADGAILDTADAESKSNFRISHPEFLREIEAMAILVKANKPLADRIRHKYKLKNTTGYSLNALVDFSDPFEIIEHLIIGSEGTLGFISEITYHTVIEHPFRATSLMLFPSLELACKAVIQLKKAPVAAVELIDRAGIRAVENHEGIGAYLKELSPLGCALLVETRALSKGDLRSQIESITKELESSGLENSIYFTSIPKEYEALWKIRKGLFPSIGSIRKTGTTVIIEDVAFPLERLAEATLDLQKSLQKWGYSNAVIFGHALEGNLHFVFTQDFGSSDEVERYSQFMTEVTDLVVTKYDGSLKAEHGTGRNMAPFIELEWGAEAFGLMKQLKSIFDPNDLLNPGVILNNDPKAHLQNLKPLPAAHESIDKCVECGFCEPSCVSADLTLTPRQRIAVYRQITHLTATGTDPKQLAYLNKGFEYSGITTCATDGLCATSCPVDIDTGKLIKNLRNQRVNSTQKAHWISKRIGGMSKAIKMLLNTANLFHTLLGSRIMKGISTLLHILSFKRIPKWNRFLPKGAHGIDIKNSQPQNLPRKVVYFSSCINRTMGISKGQPDKRQLSDVLVQLLNKGGFEVIYPGNMTQLCCGMAFSSKGYSEVADQKAKELEQALIQASKSGKYPILCDMSPCLSTMKATMKNLKLYEPTEFILDQLMPHLTIKPIQETITVFPVCSAKKMGLEDKLIELAEKCASKVIVTESNCCGFAGDLGFTTPELNAHGLKGLKEQLPEDVKRGFSTSRTCEIGLSEHTGIDYQSIVYLVDQVSS